MKPTPFAFAIMCIASAASAAETELWRLDCGTIVVKDINAFSDSFAYPPASRTLTDSCYLIRHDDDYLLWDAGLPAALVDSTPDPDAAMQPSLIETLPAQLARIDVTPEMIGRIGISHGHFDHTGQAAAFPQAALLIGQADWSAMTATPQPFGFDPVSLDHWINGGGTVKEVSGDTDIFGDGSVTMLQMPGHTQGETALLVRLADTGPVLLSGDVVHFQDQIATQSVPPFNANRAETLASMARLTEIADNLSATLIIQHEPADIAKLPAFPESAE